MQIRFYTGIVPLNQRLALLNVTALDEESGLEDLKTEEIDDLDTL